MFNEKFIFNLSILLTSFLILFFFVKPKIEAMEVNKAQLIPDTKGLIVYNKHSQTYSKYSIDNVEYFKYRYFLYLSNDSLITVDLKTFIKYNEGDEFKNLQIRKF